MNKYMERAKVCTALFYGPFWEKNIKDRVKLLGSNVFLKVFKVVV